MDTSRSATVGSRIATAVLACILLAAAAAFAAQDTMIDATFSTQDGRPLGSISTDPAVAASEVIEYCPDALPLQVMIHAQAASGAGAEYAAVQLLIDGAVVVTDTLDMAGVVTVSLDQPDVSATAGGAHEVAARLLADTRFNASEAAGALQVADCGESEGGRLGFVPFRFRKRLLRVEGGPYVAVPLQEAIDIIWATRDRIAAMNQRGELLADTEIVLPEHLVQTLERIVNEDPGVLRGVR